MDTEKCDGCGECVAACPYGVLAVIPNDLDPLADTMVVAVTEEERKKIKYTCAPCKPVTGERNLPCVLACEPGAISHSW